MPRVTDGHRAHLTLQVRGQMIRSKRGRITALDGEIAIRNREKAELEREIAALQKDCPHPREHRRMAKGAYGAQVVECTLCGARS